MVMFEIWSVGCKPFEEKTAVEVSQYIAELKYIKSMKVTSFLEQSVSCVLVF